MNIDLNAPLWQGTADCSSRLATEYLMLSSLSVENFRCFKSVKVDKLSRVNIIVGDNAAGKTTLLEAIQLASSASPQELIKLNQQRNIIIAMQSADQEQFNSLWNHLFHTQDASKPIRISHTTSEGKTASLEISYRQGEQIIGGLGQVIMPMAGNLFGQLNPGSIQPASAVIPLEFRRSNYDGVETLSYAGIGPQGQLIIQPAEKIGPSLFFFSSSGQYQDNLINDWYSQQIEKTNGKENLLSLFRKIYPTIDTIDLIAKLGQAKINVSQKHYKQLLPLSLVSAGMSKVLSILLGIMSINQGVVLIDEIENGIYYKADKEMWQLILQVTKQTGTQVFATTHSEECMEALLVAAEGHTKDISLIRTERGDNNAGAIVRHFSGEEFRAGIEAGGEVR